MIEACHQDPPERMRRAAARCFGLQFDEARLTFLGDVLRRRAAANSLSIDSYLARLEGGVFREELKHLAGELTVTETYFFRNIEQFHALREIVLPGYLQARAAVKSLRFLSAGCASGEEPYSIAMLTREVIADPSWRISVRAVDINPAALARAARARFSRWSLRETPPEAQQTWFRPDGDEFVLDPTVRAAVTFDERNLTVDGGDPWQAEAYDVIFCRNVLMYLTPDHAQQVVRRIARALAPGGYLFLGYAETLRGLSQQFHLCHTHGTFYYQRKETNGTRPHIDTDVPVLTASTPALTAVSDGADGWIDAIDRATARIERLTRRDAPAPAAVSAPRPDLGVARDLLRQERFAEALDLLQHLPPASKRDPEVLLLRAVLLAHVGQLAAAEHVCQQLLALEELNAGAHYVVALCREGAGDCEGAAHHDQVAAYLDPLFAMPRLHLGLLARRAGRRDEARREFSQALVLLEGEDTSRLVFFSGGFTRGTLIGLCRAELDLVGGHR